MTREQLGGDIARFQLARAFRGLVESFAWVTLAYVVMGGVAATAAAHPASAYLAYVLGFAPLAVACRFLRTAYDLLVVIDPRIRRDACADVELHMVELTYLDNDASAPQPGGRWFGMATDPTDARVRAYCAVRDTEDRTVIAGAVYAGPELHGIVPPEECRRNGIHRAATRPHAGRKACAYCKNV